MRHSDTKRKKKIAYSYLIVLIILIFTFGLLVSIKSYRFSAKSKNYN